MADNPLATLNWLVEAGADEAIADTPVNRLVDRAIGARRRAFARVKLGFLQFRSYPALARPPPLPSPAFAGEGAAGARAKSPRDLYESPSLPPLPRKRGRAGVGA